MQCLVALLRKPAHSKIAIHENSRSRKTDVAVPYLTAECNVGLHRGVIAILSMGVPRVHGATAQEACAVRAHVPVE
jgi:hypothetical protein